MAEVWRRDLASDDDDASSPSHDDRAPLAGLVVSCAPQDVPPLLWASCDSSDLRSEEGSEEGSGGAPPSLRSVSSAASSEDATTGDGTLKLLPPPSGRRRGPGEEDPFADVRDRMERLCREDSIGPEEIDMTGLAPISTYLGFAMVAFMGHLRDWCARAFRRGRYFGPSKRR